MTTRARSAAIVVGVLVVAWAVIVLVVKRPIADVTEERGGRQVVEPACADGVEADIPANSVARPATATQESESSYSTPPEHEVEPLLSEDERREREETALVDAFVAVTDKWMEPVKGGVAMKDVDEFAAQFRKLPKSRRHECLQRALNLIPDENVMLLVGILMDKSQDKELVELVYNDVLNRDESVKKPVLREIFKDRNHPFWADTAWILDITGELPGKK